MERSEIALLSNTSSTPLSWFEISIKASSSDTPIISEFLANISTNGVTIEPAIQILDDLDFGFTYLNELSTIRAYIEKPYTTAERVNFRKRLNALPLTAKIPRISYRVIQNDDWSNEWKKYYKIEFIGEHIVVCPSWIEYQPNNSETKITLDPGAAFGTGQHPTIQLCLISLERYVQKYNTVIDIGCGSGILSIGAILLGAEKAFALDIDKNAIQITLENSKMNHTNSKIQAAHGTLGHNWPEQFPEQSELADIAIANISTNTILKLVSLIKSALKNEGLAILSGFIKDSLPEINAQLEQHNFKIIDTLDHDDWTCIIAIKI